MVKPGGVDGSARSRATSPIAAASWTSPRQDPRVALERLRPAPGYEVNLFASEEQFPDLAKPVAMTFDATRAVVGADLAHLPAPAARRRRRRDKLVILEDTNTDGRADTLTVFADGLHLPMGFELGDGGVYVSQRAEPDVPARHQRRRPRR